MGQIKIVIIYIIIDSLFIFSVSKLLLDAASYDGEIWHADAWRPCPGLLLVFVSIWGRRYDKKMTFFPQIRLHIMPRRFAAVSHCRQRVGPVRPTQTGGRSAAPYAGLCVGRQCRSLISVAWHCCQRQHRPHWTTMSLVSAVPLVSVAHRLRLTTIGL